MTERDQAQSKLVREFAWSPSFGESSFKAFGEFVADALLENNRDNLEMLLTVLKVRLSNPFFPQEKKLKLTGGMLLVGSGLFRLYVPAMQDSPEKEAVCNDTKLMEAAYELMAGNGNGAMDTFSLTTVDAILTHNTLDLKTAYDQLRRLEFSAYPEVEEIAKGMKYVVEPVLGRLNGGQS